MARPPCPFAVSAAAILTASCAAGQPSSVPPGDSPTVYKTAAVAADHALASNAGLEILRDGGNAVDAAVASSFALSVVRPYSCGIGGGGFMVIHLKHHPRREPVTTVVNYRETAPAAVGPTYFENVPDPDAATHGGKSVAIPGTVAGLLYALEQYGTLLRERVLAPAIRLAREGFKADQHYIDSCRKDDLVLPWYEKDPRRAERFAFLWDRYLLRGKVQLGDAIAVPEQAQVLQKIADEGPAGFYSGPVARAIVDTVAADGGALTPEDLAGYRVEEREPLRTSFRGRTVFTMPPPSSGGIVLAQALGILERRWPDMEMALAAGHNSPGYVHLVAEASKHGFADRARWMGDPNFVHVPVRGLLAPEYLDSRAAAIDMRSVRPLAEYGTAEYPPAEFPEDGGTSHLCVVDRWGNAVGCTETVNLIFGSHLVVPEFGIVLNDTMDDFLTRDGHANAFGLDHAEINRPRAGKRPLSSMTPTIVTATNPDGAPGAVQLIAGGAGGPRIISGTLQASLNVLVWDMPADAALAAPRFHHQWHPDSLDLEPALRDGPLEQDLKSRGHHTGRRAAVANVQIIRRRGEGWQAASDPRKGGAPAGY